MSRDESVEEKQRYGVIITDEQRKVITEAVVAEFRKKVLDIIFERLEADIDKGIETIKQIIDEIEHEGLKDANNQKRGGEMAD